MSSYSLPETSMDSVGTAAQGGPLFTIVVPVWNRFDAAKRCVNSILSQDFSDYEIVVVDDGSTDGTADRLREAFTDPRVRVLVHAKNAGVCATRHTGTAAALGRWIVSVDCDWALDPGALTLMAKNISDVAPQVGAVSFCVTADTGEQWPPVLPPAGLYGLKEYMEWADIPQCSACVTCRRREVFADVQWPTDRRLELQFMYRVADRWELIFLPDIVATVYEDAPHSLSYDRSAASIRRSIGAAPAMAQATEEIIAEFGPQARKWSPRTYWRLYQGAGYYNFQAGNRWRGLKWSCKAWIRKPWAVQVPILIMAGLMGPEMIFRIRTLRWARIAFTRLTLIISGKGLKTDASAAQK